MSEPGDRLESLMATFRERRKQAAETQRQIDAVTGTAMSRHQTVKATVNVQGELTDLEFPTTAFRRMTAVELADTIKAALADAKLAAAAKVRALDLPEVAEGVSYADVVLGTADVLKTMAEEL